MKCSSFNFRFRVACRPCRRVPPRRALVAVRAESAPIVDTLVKVKFTIPHHVEFGQSVCILGSAAELGEWQIDKSPCLTWGEGDVWSGVVELPPSDIEYKYFTKNPDGSPAEWQPGEKNLKAQILVGPEMDVMDEWGGEIQETATEEDVTAEATEDVAEVVKTEGAGEAEMKPPTAEAAIPGSVQELTEEVVSDPKRSPPSSNSSKDEVSV